MKFPVDLLATVDPEALERSAKDYMSKLLYRSPGIRETLSLPDSREIEVSLCNVSFMPLYGADIKQKVLVLLSPEDCFKAVTELLGLYLLGQWWSAEDILKTADPSRTGLLEVLTLGERIVLYVLNRIIYRKDIGSDDVPFLCHGEHEVAKILWKDGKAIGFYSVKPEGALCSSYLTQCYQLPVMDTIFIRKFYRGNGYGLQMLKDFVSTFRKECLGLKYPLSPAMYRVCKNYFSTYPADKELLWEVEGIGGPFQRTLIAKRLQTKELKEHHRVVSKLNFEAEDTDVPVEKVTTQVQKTMEYTEEVVEEVVQFKMTKEVQDTPVTTRARSSNLKRKKLGEDMEASTEKIIRVEDIEAGVQTPMESRPEGVKSIKEVYLKERTVTLIHGEENVLDVTHVHCEGQKELTAEPKECVLEVCALTRPTTEPVIVSPEEALEKTEILQMTSVPECQRMKSNKKTQIVCSFETTITPVDLQPLELQEVVEVEVVKMSSGREEVTVGTDLINEVVLISEEIRQEGSGIENKEQTSVVRPALVTVTEDQEFKAAGKEKAEKAKVGKISVSKNVVGEEAEEKDKENMEIEEGTVSEDKAVVPVLSVAEKEHMEQLQEVEPIKDTSMVQESTCEKETETKAKEQGQDGEVKSNKWTEEDNSEKAGNSVSTGRHAHKQRSNYATPLKHTETFIDQSVEGELYERVLRSGKKSVTTISKLRCVQHTKAVKQHGVSAQAVGEPGWAQGEEQKEEKNYTVKITNVKDNENETAGDDNKIAVERFDDARFQDEWRTTQQPLKEQVEESSLEMAQNADKHNVVESTSHFILQQPAVVPMEVSPRNTSDIENTEKTSQSQEEVDQEHDVLEGTEEERDQSKEEKEVVKHTESQVEQAEKVQTVGNETPSQEENWLNKATVAEEEMVAEVPMTESLDELVVSADTILQTDSEQENTIFKEENTGDTFRETEDCAVSKNEDRVPELSDTDQGQIKVVQKEEPLKKAVLLQEIPGNEETEIKDVSNTQHDDAENKSDNWTEPTKENDSDKAGDSGSKGKHAASRKSNTTTPLRRSQRCKDQPAESELSERVLRSGKKSVTTLSKQMHERHYKAMKQQKENVCEHEAECKEKDMESHSGSAEGEKLEAVGVTNEGHDETLTTQPYSVQEDSKMENECLEAKTTDDHNVNEVENKMEESSQNETNEDGQKTVVMVLDDSDIVKDTVIEAEGKTTQQPVVESVGKQEKETATEMTQEEDGQNVVKSTSAFILQQAAVILMDFNKVSLQKTGHIETTEETSKSQEEVDQERDILASTEEERDQSKEEKEVVKHTECLVKLSEKGQTAGNETSLETTSQDKNKLNKDEVAEEEMVVQDPMTESLDELVEGAEKILQTDSEQEKTMLEEEHTDDKVKKTTLEEESTETVAENTAAVYTSESGNHLNEDQESIRPENEETVKEIPSEKETPVITSRSLRQGIIIVKSPPEKICVHKSGVEVMDNINKGSTDKTEEKKDEKVQAEDSAVSKNKERVPESSDTDQGQIKVVQEEELLQTLEQIQVIPGNENTEIKDVSKRQDGDEEDKSDKWAEPTEEKDSDKADDTGSTGKHAVNQKSNNATPLRRSQRCKDQPAESELTERVLRSGKKSVTTLSKQMHERHYKAMKQQKENVCEPEAECKEKVMESHSGSAEAEQLEAVGVTNEGHDKTLTTQPYSVQEDSKIENECLEPETTDDHNVNEVENKMEDSSKNETNEDGQKAVVMVLDHYDIVKDTVKETGKATQQKVGEPVEEQEEEAATEMAQEEDGWNVMESTSACILQQAGIVLLDFNNVPPRKTGDSETNEETLLSLDRKEYNVEEVVKQTEPLVEPTEKEQRYGDKNSTETGQKEGGLNKTSVAEEHDAFTEIGVEESMTENLEEQPIDVGTDNMTKTDGKQEKSMLAEEKLDDDKVKEVSLEEKSCALMSKKTAEVYTSKSEKNLKSDQVRITSGHGESVEESLPEDMPVITSRSLRRRTVTVISPPERKSKHLQKTGVEITENEKIQMSEVLDKTGSTEIKNKDENEEGEDGAVDRVQKPTVTDQSQMEVEQEEPVKEASILQKVPGNEKLTIKQAIESKQEETVVPDINLAANGKEAEIGVEVKAQEQSALEPDEEQVDTSAIKMPEEAGQKAEESTSVFKLQKASVVLVDFNKVSPIQTTEDTLQPQEGVCQELDKPADTSMHADESEAEEQGMKRTEAQVEPAEKSNEEEVPGTISMNDSKNETAEVTSEKRDKNNDEKMETEEDDAKEDRSRLAELVQEKKFVKDTTVQEIPYETEAQELSESDKEKPCSQAELSKELISDKKPKADSTRKQCDNEILESRTPGKCSRQLMDQPVSELTTRVLRSATKQVKTTTNQQCTKQTEKSEQRMHEPKEKSDQIMDLQTDIANGDKIMTINVVTEGATPNLITPLDGRAEMERKIESSDLQVEKIKDNEVKEQKMARDVNMVEEDISTKEFSKLGKVTTEDVLFEEATEATSGEEKILALHVIPRDAETEVEGEALAQFVAQPVEEQEEAIVTETAQKEDEQITVNKENPKETTQSQEKVDIQVNIGKDKKEINGDEKKMEQAESLEVPEKEKIVGEKATETTQPQDEEGLDSTEVYSAQGSEQEESLLAEEKLKDNKFGDITLDEEPTVSMTAINKSSNQKEDKESMTPDHRGSVQESSPKEETTIIAGRSLRHRTVKVNYTPQRKSKCFQKPGVHAEKAEVDKETDISKAEIEPSICIPMEGGMHAKNVEDEKVSSEMEKQEYILGGQKIGALIAEEIPETELKILENITDEGNAIMKEGRDKENREIAETAVNVEITVLSTKEEEKVSEVKSIDSIQDKDGGMVSFVQDSTAQKKDLEMPASCPAKVVVGATTQSQPAQHNTEDEESVKEEETIVTKNLRRRTVIVHSLIQTKSKHFLKEVMETYTDKPQTEIEGLLREPSKERETVEGIEEVITAVEEKNEIRITETNSKDESKYAQVGSEGMNNEVAIDKQEGENILKTDGEKVEKISVQGKDSEMMSEKTEKEDGEILVEGKDVIDNNLEKELNKEELGSANREQENNQQENVQDKVEEKLLEEKSVVESRILEEKQITEKEDKGNMSNTEDILDEAGEGVVVERSLRKRRTTIKVTSERKSKRLRKQDHDEKHELIHVDLTEDPLSGDKPVIEHSDAKSFAENETQITSKEQVDSSEKDREMLSEECQETTTRTGNEEDEQVQVRELINVSMEEPDTKIEAQEVDKAEVEEGNKTEPSEGKEEAAEHENKSTENDDRGADTEIKESQDKTVANEKNGKEYNEFSLTVDESFTLELDEEDENNGPKENKVLGEMEGSLSECPNVVSTTIHNTDKYDEHITDKEEQPAVMKQKVIQDRSAAAAASPGQRSKRQSKQFVRESQSEMEDTFEAEALKEAIKEDKGKTKSQQKRKAMEDLTPRRSKRLARLKIV